MREEVVFIINEILEDEGKVKLDQIEDGMRLMDDLKLDSFDLAVLTVKLEDKFNVDIYKDGILITFGDLMKVLSERDE